MNYIFTPEQKVINDLFGNDVTYIIPEYQRPYSWDSLGKSDRNNQVNVMWEDLNQAFADNPKGTYFIGSMVLISNERTYEVIDGQQRLTTLVLLFVAIKCFLKSLDETQLDEKLKKFKNDVIQNVDLLIYNKTIFGVLETDKKVKIAKNAYYDYDAVLESAMECKKVDSINLKGLQSDQSEIIKRYFRNRDFFEDRLKEEYFEEGVFTFEKAGKLNSFIEFLKNKVSLVRILTQNFEAAYHIFEVMNNRGLPLSNKDLLRNFIIKEFDKLKNSEPDKYINLEPKTKWLELEDVLTDEFLPRWVESMKASQQQYSAFNDLQEIYANYYKDQFQSPKIEQLFNDLKEDTFYYDLIVNDSIEDRKIRNKVRFLLKQNHKYTTNLLLALFRFEKYDGKSNDFVLRYIVAYERLIFDYLVGHKLRFSKNLPYQFIRILISFVDGVRTDDIQTKEDLINSISKETEDVQKWFITKALEMGRIYDNDIAKLLIAKYIWFLDYKTTDDVVEQTLDYDKSTLEHIIPQTPEKNSNWDNDFSKKFKEDFTYKLGNFTLLTQKTNSAAKNYDFEKKKVQYLKTKLATTQNIAQLDKIDEAFIKKRHDEIVNGILEDLGLV